MPDYVGVLPKMLKPFIARFNDVMDSVRLRLMGPNLLGDIPQVPLRCERKPAIGHAAKLSLQFVGKANQGDIEFASNEYEPKEVKKTASEIAESISHRNSLFITSLENDGVPISDLIREIEQHLNAAG